MKIFLAGAGGVVGRRIIPLLADAGHDVIGMTRSITKAPLVQSLGARPIVVNAFDRSEVFSAVIAERPDIVIHQMTDLSHRNFEANARLRIEGTRNLIDAAISAGVRRVVGQSIAWAYTPGSGKAQEEDVLDIGSTYKERRRMAEAIQTMEEILLEVDFAVVLRYGMFYGPGTWYARDGWFAQEVLRGQAPISNAITSFIHIDDAARASVMALDWPRGIVNIVDDDPTPGTVWLPIYAALLGAPPPPSGTDNSTTRGASNEKAKYQLNWQLTHPTWRNGLLD